MMQLRTTEVGINQIYPYMMSWLLVQNALNDNNYAQAKLTKVNQQAHLRSVIDDFPNPCYLKTVNSGNSSIYSNHLFKEIFVVNDNYNTDLLDNSWQNNSSQFQQAIAALSEIEKSALISGQDVIDKVLPIFTDASGKLIMLVVNMTVIMHDTNKVSGLFCRLKDLTEVMSSKRLLNLYNEHTKNKRVATKHFLEHIGFADELVDEKESISKRELDCMIKLAEGKTAKETARELFISHRTVEAHIENAKLKLGIKKKHELLSLFKSYFR